MRSLTGLVACVAARHQLFPRFTPLEYIRIQFVFKGGGWMEYIVFNVFEC